MKDFIHTGWYGPTLTTADDPCLKIIESDNGINWLMRFYVGEQQIDCINMEYLHGSEIHESIKSLPVYSEENIFLGTVEKQLKEALGICSHIY